MISVGRTLLGNQLWLCRVECVISVGRTSLGNQVCLCRVEYTCVISVGRTSLGNQVGRLECGLCRVEHV